MARDTIARQRGDENKTIHSDGTVSINHEVGVNNSKLHSKSGISKDASMKVYDHYNPTDLEVDYLLDYKAGMQLIHDKNLLGYWYTKIGIKLDKNHELGYSDNIYEIINMFIHEEKHLKDLKKFGSKYLNEFTVESVERSACRTQLNHDTFSKTSEDYQTAMLKYAAKNGYGVISKVKAKSIKLDVNINLKL